MDNMENNNNDIENAIEKDIKNASFIDESISSKIDSLNKEFDDIVKNIQSVKLRAEVEPENDFSSFFNKPKDNNNNKKISAEQKVDNMVNYFSNKNDNFQAEQPIEVPKEEKKIEQAINIVPFKETDDHYKTPQNIEKTKLVIENKQVASEVHVEQVIEKTVDEEKKTEQVSNTPSQNKEELSNDSQIVKTITPVQETKKEENIIRIEHIEEKPKEDKKETEKSSSTLASLVDQVTKEYENEVKDTSIDARIDKADKEAESIVRKNNNLKAVKPTSTAPISFRTNNKKTIKKEVLKPVINDNGTNGDDNNGKTKHKAKRPKGKIITFIFAILACLGVLIEICCILGAGYFAYKLCEGKPEFSAAMLDSADSSIIYDVNGNQIMELGLYLRENIEYDDVPNCVIDAFVSIEDSRFFEHFGFDIPRFTKAILENLKTMSFGQGGSTMTMQLVKNSYFQTDDGEESTMAARTGMSGVQRKMQEIVLSIEAEQALSKQEILVLYLNKLNFGDNIRGIQKAAEYYFGKKAKDLSLNEAAFLAGIINAPNGNNPYNAAYGNTDYLKNANARKNEVLDLMVYHGYITKEEAELNKKVMIENLLAGKNVKFSETNQIYQSFIDAVINEAQEQTGKSPYTTAMNIYTSMDPYMQEYVYNMQNHPEMFEDKYKFRHDLQQNALVVMNNQTGALIALGGGRYQEDKARQFNRAIDSYINPGSSIKPVLEYVLAFDKLGYATSHTICDKPIFLYETDIVVANAYGQGYTGDMKITEALARSLNTPAIQLLEQVIDKIGEEEVIKYCQSIGLDWCNENTFDIQWAIGGRDCLVSPVQLAGAHGMLMHNGKYIKPHTISKIEYRGKYNEEEDYIADTEGTQVVSPAAAFMTATCERYNVTSGWINQLDLLKRDYPTYAKTGTTNFSEEAYKNYRIPETAAKDQWLCTQTSNYTIVVWNGFDKLEDDAYFTVTDENYNLKCKMGSILLDAVMEHYNYDAKEVEQPDDCIEITHVLGSFPYIKGGGATGYISKYSEYAEPVNAGEVQKEKFGGTLYHMGIVPSQEGIYLHWDEFNAYLEDGRVDTSATSVSGKVTVIATGRSYYQRYNFINPDMFYATVTPSEGDPISVESPVPTTLVEAPGPGPYTVCGWTSANPNPVCSSK